jgi:hypothetical protein
MTKYDVKKPADEWAKQDGILVIDDDGWRDGAPLGKKSFNEPITREEYEQRAWVSTLGPRERKKTHGKRDTHPKLGAWVRTDAFNRSGRVTDIHLGCPEDDAWLACQSDRRVIGMKDEVWVSILVHEGGAVTVPAELTHRIDPIPNFKNTWASFYFDEEPREKYQPWNVPVTLSPKRPSRSEILDFEDAHFEGLHDEVPREFCPECERRGRRA